MVKDYLLWAYAGRGRYSKLVLGRSLALTPNALTPQWTSFPFRQPIFSGAVTTRLEWVEGFDFGLPGRCKSLRPLRPNSL
jgi:hypothetical protein